MTYKLRFIAAILFIFFTAIFLFSKSSDDIKGNSNIYYVDSNSGNDSNDGLSEQNPFKTLNKINSLKLIKGEKVLFKKDCVFKGSLSPKGNGTKELPIVFGCYGEGKMPVIDGGNDKAVISFKESQGIHIQDLEIIGGKKYGIHFYTQGNGTVLNHFRLKNLIVHNLMGGFISSKSCGLIVFQADVMDNRNSFSDIVIENVNAYDTDQWAGIMISGGGYAEDGPRSQSDGVIIRNCTVHDVGGDGILVMLSKNVLIENNICYRSGMQKEYTVGTPAGIWTWATSNTVLQFNESYDNQTPDYDGAPFDLDYHNKNNLIQYNYGHDSEGPGIMILGAERDETYNCTIRYNIFSNNARADQSYHSGMQGEVYISCWNLGKLNKIRFHNNTIYYNPPKGPENYCISEFVMTVAEDVKFYNNIIYSTSKYIISSKKLVDYDYNCYYTVFSEPEWYCLYKRYKGLKEWQSLGFDLHSINVNPDINKVTYSGVGTTDEFKLKEKSKCIDAGADLKKMGIVDDMGNRDFYGIKIPQGKTYDIGASEFFIEK